MGKIKKIRAVIDTNVIVSAILFGGIPGKLISLWKSGHLKPLASKDIIDEYIKVLAYPKFRLTEKEINYILYNEILPYFEVVTLKPGLRIIQKDPSDDKFFHCAEAGKAGVIISGDQHLLNLKTYGDLKILTPLQFLEKL
jgi:putative PIN family toxin of toxin-antitoxin system